MKNCPDCRNPIASLVLVEVESVTGVEYYCERCCRTFPVPAKKAPAPKKRKAALV